MSENSTHSLEGNTKGRESNKEKPKNTLDNSNPAEKKAPVFAALRKRYPTQVQFVLFCIVGGSGVIVDYAVLIPLTEFAHLDPRLAAVGAFIAAVTWNYLLNRKFTFEADQNVKISTSYTAFVGVCLVGLAVRIGVMHALMTWLGMGKGRWYLLASLIGIAAATVTNFLGSKYFAFRENREKL